MSGQQVGVLGSVCCHQDPGLTDCKVGGRV